mgnify:CR=1 FL=1
MGNEYEQVWYEFKTSTEQYLLKANSVFNSYKL